MAAPNHDITPPYPRYPTVHRSPRHDRIGKRGRPIHGALEVLSQWRSILCVDIQTEARYSHRRDKRRAAESPGCGLSTREIPEGVNPKAMTTTDNKPDDELYIKRPPLLAYETSDPLALVRDIFGEAEIMEQASSINHKDIVQHYGCQARDGRPTGIVLEHHKCNLLEYFSWEWDKDGLPWIRRVSWRSWSRQYRTCRWQDWRTTT
ncbi:hypothetical protein F4824DRAFT_467452 [Ustulina deusta]|nr:hypothetical protein F4824DRAFT_467452 [Ustulina deusta]